LDVASDAIPIDQFPKENRSAIAQLGYPVAKLKARIGHRQWLSALRHPVPRQDLDALRRGQLFRAEPEVKGQTLVQPDKTRPGYRGWRQALKEPFRKPRITIIEWKERVVCHRVLQ
jgi:hypothetical protein